VYAYAFKKPLFVKLDVKSGSNSGGGIVWTGGDSVKGHRGGILSGIHLTLPLHDKQVVSLRGDSIDTGTIPAMLDVFKQVKGDVTEAPGPTIAGTPTDVVTLKVADPTTDKGVSRVVLYLSKATHLPVRRDQFTGDALVKSETFSNMKTNVGLKDSDFPF
jgi:outer membrane lipoprotein-sorting protein